MRLHSRMLYVTGVAYWNCLGDTCHTADEVSTKGPLEPPLSVKGMASRRRGKFLQRTFFYHVRSPGERQPKKSAGHPTLHLLLPPSGTSLANITFIASGFLFPCHLFHEAQPDPRAHLMPTLHPQTPDPITFTLYHSTRHHLTFCLTTHGLYPSYAPRRMACL